jgi:hypothetical protein
MCIWDQLAWLAWLKVCLHIYDLYSGIRLKINADTISPLHLVYGKIQNTTTLHMLIWLVITYARIQIVHDKSQHVNILYLKKGTAHVGMFGMRNFRYRYTEKIIPILSVYRFSFDNYKGKFFNGNLKEILSNSKKENDNFEAVSNMFRTTHTLCKISLKWKF